MTRVWSLALPVVTVLVVAYALLVAGVPRPIVGARVYGGPTAGAGNVSLRVEVVKRDGEREAPIWPGPMGVRASVAGGAPLSMSVAHAVNGVSDFALAFGRPTPGPIALSLRADSGALLAEGALELDGARWAARARRRGGFIRGRALGALVLSIAPERGVFVVGAPDPLWIRVEREGRAVSGATLSVTADGARVSGADSLRTDARGIARFSFNAEDLNPTLRAEAHTEDGQSGVIDSGVPVVPGGFHATPTEGGMRVESAVPRDEAFFSVVNDTGRITGGVLSLTPDGRGGSVGVVALSALPHPSWFVVSSAVDENSIATIGWPLDIGSEPAQTFDVPETLLLDGLPAAFQHEQDRRSRVRWLTALFIALAFALSVVLLVVRVRAADREITRHLRDGLDPDAALRIAPRHLLALLVGLLALGLGFVALGLIVAARSQ